MFLFILSTIWFSYSLITNHQPLHDPHTLTTSQIWRKLEINYLIINISRTDYGIYFLRILITQPLPLWAIQSWICVHVFYTGSEEGLSIIENKTPILIEGTFPMSIIIGTLEMVSNSLENNEENIGKIGTALFSFWKIPRKIVDIWKHYVAIIYLWEDIARIINLINNNIWKDHTVSFHWTPLRSKEFHSTRDWFDIYYEVRLNNFHIYFQS